MLFFQYIRILRVVRRNLQNTALESRRLVPEYRHTSKLRRTDGGGKKNKIWTNSRINPYLANVENRVSW